MSSTASSVSRRTPRRRWSCGAPAPGSAATATWAPGNYNSQTARLYEDIGLLSSDTELGEDLTDLFNYLTGYSRQRQYRRLLVAPVTLRSGIVELIRTQTHATGRIIIKCNHLIDPEVIEALYAASCAGARIDLIVRSSCGVRPGIAGMSENIWVRSLVGRYLEHSRIYHFGDDRWYIGSADLMGRNLDGRIETVVPVIDPRLQARLAEVVEVLLADDVLASELQRRRQLAQGADAFADSTPRRSCTGSRSSASRGDRPGGGRARARAPSRGADHVLAGAARRHRRVRRGRRRAGAPAAHHALGYRRSPPGPLGRRARALGGPGLGAPAARDQRGDGRAGRRRAALRRRTGAAAGAGAAPGPRLRAPRAHRARRPPGHRDRARPCCSTPRGPALARLVDDTVSVYSGPRITQRFREIDLFSDSGPLLDLIATRYQAAGAQPARPRALVAQSSRAGGHAASGDRLGHPRERGDRRGRRAPGAEHVGHPPPSPRSRGPARHRRRGRAPGTRRHPPPAQRPAHVPAAPRRGVGRSAARRPPLARRRARKGPRRRGPSRSPPSRRPRRCPPPTADRRSAVVAPLVAQVRSARRHLLDRHGHRPLHRGDRPPGRGCSRPRPDRAGGVAGA